MGLDIFKERGVPLERQQFTWRDMVQSPISKLDNDAFTRAHRSDERAGNGGQPLQPLLRAHEQGLTVAARARAPRRAAPADDGQQAAARR